MKDAITEVIEIDPKDQSAYYNLGIYYYNAEHDRPNAYQNFKIIGFRIIEMIRSGYARPADIFVLAPSVKSENSPIKLIENMLVNNNIPCFVPMSETSSISSEIIKNKVIFSSFHQSKGRERKVVVVYGFDDSYFAFFNKDSDPQTCISYAHVEQ